MLGMGVSKSCPGFHPSHPAVVIPTCFLPRSVSPASLLTPLEMYFFVLIDLWYPVISWCGCLALLLLTSGSPLFSSGILSMWSVLGGGVFWWACSIPHYQQFVPSRSVPCSPPNSGPPPPPSSQIYTTDFLSSLMDWVFVSHCFNRVLPQQLCSIL